VVLTDHRYSLLEPFYGWDNLVLMCRAKRLRISPKTEIVSFWVGPYIVRISTGKYTDYNGVYYPYHVYIFHRKTKECLYHMDVLAPEHVRSAFTRATGYVLEF